MVPRVRLAVLLIGSAWMLSAGSAASQDYPTKPIAFVVANSPGTSPDLVARIIGPEMAKYLGQPVVIENKPGAGDAVGYAYVVNQAPANGYTIVLAIVQNLATLPLTVKGLSFNALKDLPPFIGLVEGRYVFGLSSKLPWTTFNELVAYAKANPGKLNWGASGALSRLTTEALLQDVGIKVTYIPYSGGGPYVQALVGGEIQMGFVGEAAVASLGEKFRALALTGKQRSASFPNAPTFIELGRAQIPGLTFSLNAAVGTPKAAIDKLYAAASRALQQPEVRDRFAKARFEVIGQTTEAAEKDLAEQGKLFAEIARKTGIQPQ